MVTMPSSNKTNWRRLVTEAVAIGLGVFLSLWADEWRASRLDASEGRAALRRIAADLENDTVALVAMSARAERQVNAIREILIADPNDPDTPLAIAERLPDVVVSSVTPVSRSAYDALVSSGQLGLVDDPDLLADIADHYARLDYLVAISDEESQQRRLLAALFYPHVDWPRDDFFIAGELHFLPTPSARPSVTSLLSDSEFVGQMVDMGTLKEIKAERGLANVEEARDLIRAVYQAAAGR